MIFLGNIRTILPVFVLVAVLMANDVAWYQSMLRERVTPQYMNAYRILKNKIINPLLTFNDEVLSNNGTNVTRIVSLAQDLTCATKDLYNTLSTALNASEGLNKDIESKLAEMMSAISQKENEVRQVNNQLGVIEAQLANAQAQVNQAENEVRNKENDLATADRNLADQERKVERARQCLGGRRKRFLKKLWRAITRPICAVFNYQGIQNAKGHRGAAQGAVNAAREQLANRRQELERQRSAQNNFQNQKSQLTTQLQSLSTNLAQLQNRQASLATITQQMRKVLSHLASFVSKSSVLYDELKSVVSFENLIAPLNAILTDLINGGISTEMMGDATQISAVETQMTTNTIDLLKELLPSLPLNEGDSYTC